MTPAYLVNTSAGVLRGAPLPDDAMLFAGVPFAAPPVGSLRLRPPQPPQPWSGVRDATTFRPPPPQRVSAVLAGQQSTSAFFPGADMWATPDNCDEDCLYLNVWTPDLTGRRPVIVWIYGGGFDSGSAAPPRTDGAALSRL